MAKTLKQKFEIPEYFTIFVFEDDDENAEESTTVEIKDAERNTPDPLDPEYEFAMSGMKQMIASLAKYELISEKQEPGKIHVRELHHAVMDAAVEIAFAVDLNE